MIADWLAGYFDSCGVGIIYVCWWLGVLWRFPAAWLGLDFGGFGVCLMIVGWWVLVGQFDCGLLAILVLVGCIMCVCWIGVFVYGAVTVVCGGWLVLGCVCYLSR